VLVIFFGDDVAVARNGLENKRTNGGNELLDTEIEIGRKVRHYMKD